MSAKTTPARHKSNLRNVYGTFAIEGMTISKDTRSNLDRIVSGQAGYQQIVNELRTSPCIIVRCAIKRSSIEYGFSSARWS